MHDRPGCYVSEKFYVINFYNYDGMNFMKEFCGKGDAFYDVGANVGPFSSLAHCGGADVFGFEGAPSTVKRLRNNFEINGIRANQAINAAGTDLLISLMPKAHPQIKSVNLLIC